MAITCLVLISGKWQSRQTITDRSASWRAKSAVGSCASMYVCKDGGEEVTPKYLPAYALDDRNYAPRDQTALCTFDPRGVFLKLLFFLYLRAGGGVCNWARLDRNHRARVKL